MQRCSFGKASNGPLSRTTRRLGVLVPVLALIALPMAGPASADLQLTYDVTAAADGVRSSVYLDNFLIVSELADVGAPTAQATANSALGNAGFASYPYPGSTVLAAPDTVGGATGQDVPPYPLYARSKHPTEPESAVEQPGYSLRSRSGESFSDSAATAGVAVDPGSVGKTAASARAEVDPDSGVAVATAESDAKNLVVNGVLELGGVHSTATVTSRPDGTVSRSSELSIVDTRVAGQRVRITPDGLEAAGQQIGAPSSEQLTQTLEEAGVQLRYLAAEKGSDSIVSAALEVIATRKDPTGGSNATLTVRYVFGRASASAGGSATQFSSDAPLDTGGDQGASRQASAEPGTAPAAPEAATSDSMPAAAPTPAQLDVPTPEVAEGKQTQQAARLLGWPSDLGAVGIYLTLVFAALATLVGGTLVRLLGVRTRWMS